MSAADGALAQDCADPIAATQDTYAKVAAAYADHWDGVAPTWVGEAGARLAAELPPGALVGDIGCGPGNDTVRLRALGLRVHGFDLSHAMLTARRVPGLVRADLRALPLPDAALDGIWCVAVLLHIPRDLLPGALAELRRVLKPGGSGVIATALGEGEAWERFPHQDGGHRRYYVYHGAEEFAALVTGAGLRIRHTVRHSSHRDWLSLHVHRDPGVH